MISTGDGFQKQLKEFVTIGVLELQSFLSVSCLPFACPSGVGLQQNAEAGVGADFDVVAVRIVQVERPLTVVADLNFGTIDVHAFQLRVGVLNVLDLKGGVVRRGRRGVRIFDDVDRGAAGKLEPVQEVVVDHLGICFL